MSTRNAIILPDPSQLADRETNKPTSVPRHKCRLCDPSLGEVRFKKQRLLLAHKRQEHKTVR